MDYSLGVISLFAESRSVLWQSVSRVAHDEGLELYDLECVAGGLRVFVARVPFVQPIVVEPSAPLDSGVVESPAQVGDGVDGDLEGLHVGRRQGGVDSEDCARLCRRLVTFFSVEGAGLGVGAEPSIEVSSPWINRHLRLERHFREAVGEAVKVQYRVSDASVGRDVPSSGGDGKRTVIGLLENVSDKALFVHDSENVSGGAEVLEIGFESVMKARVEFSFAGSGGVRKNGVGRKGADSSRAKLGRGGHAGKKSGDIRRH